MVGTQTNVTSEKTCLPYMHTDGIIAKVVVKSVIKTHAGPWKQIGRREDEVHRKEADVFVESVHAALTTFGRVSLAPIWKASSFDLELLILCLLSVFRLLS